MQNKNRGAAMVEFALVVPCFFMLMCSIIYGGMIMHDINAVNELSRAGARYGAVESSGLDDKVKRDNVISYISKNDDNALFIYTIYDTDIVVNPSVDIKLKDDSADPEKGLQVTITAKMKKGLPTVLFLDYLPESMQTISSTITMRRED